jgi:hypothetical protein
MDKGRGGGVRQWGKGFLYVLGLFEGSFGLFYAYLVVIGLFLPKTEKIIKIPIKNNFKKYYKKTKCG